MRVPLACQKIRIPNEEGFSGEEESTPKLRRIVRPKESQKCDHSFCPDGLKNRGTARLEESSAKRGQKFKEENYRRVVETKESPEGPVLL